MDGSLGPTVWGTHTHPIPLRITRTRSHPRGHFTIHARSALSRGGLPYVLPVVKIVFASKFASLQNPKTAHLESYKLAKLAKNQSLLV